MTLTFALLKTTMTTLWDFSWFYLTRFRIDNLPDKRTNFGYMLAELFRNPISQRSFFTIPGPWDNLVSRHGPFPLNKLVQD